MHDKIADRNCSVYEAMPTLARHEQRTRWVVALTGTTMVAELMVGTLTNSLALTADGWHMATHAGALGVAAVAYWFARTRAKVKSFTFGTGKVNALAGYTNALILALIALLILIEAGARVLKPVPVNFAEALPVAVIGLAVNLFSVKLLDLDEDHSTSQRLPGAHDHNLRSAYFHVMADTLTSVLAIVALLGGHYGGVLFLDPLMAMVGSVVILHWSVGLCRGSARQLLDMVSSDEVARTIRAQVESLVDARVIDLHLWELGSGRLGCIVSVMASVPRPVAEYRAAILAAVPIEHLTVEVERCPHHEAA
jgi:cation diffusion facilitator family transporter